jgi:hypothetical protein
MNTTYTAVSTTAATFSNGSFPTSAEQMAMMTEHVRRLDEEQALYEVTQRLLDTPAKRRARELIAQAKAFPDLLSADGSDDRVDSMRYAMSAMYSVKSLAPSDIIKVSTL